MGSQLDKYFWLEHCRNCEGKRDMQMPGAHIREPLWRAISDAVIHQMESFVYHIILPIEYTSDRAFLMGYFNNLHIM